MKCGVCLLAKFVRTNFQNESKSNESNETIGLETLKEIRFFVDRFHLSNHKGVGNYQQFYTLIYFLI